ncbi:putative cell division cycle 2 [Gorgonomyces haynaldii]|nr:putative cell division cycle 2 [Gorgonomyces haynaldii]
MTQILDGKLLESCDSVEKYEKLNRIEEGSYGVVYRARNTETGEIVALKRLKLENEKNGFPITSLREIHTLKLCVHPHIVQVKEIVTTSNYGSIFIVMEYLEHDLKTLMTTMRQPFMLSEVKTLMQQLLSAIEFMHENWILHRDLKTSNLLMNNRGQIKVADFGLARRFGSPLGHVTDLVVTLWYRCPELLLGAKSYTTQVDMWSIGCIFGELTTREPVFQGNGEIDQLGKIFQVLGTPNESNWPGFSELPNSRILNFGQHQSKLSEKFHFLPKSGLDLLEQLLKLNPNDRISASDGLRHKFFQEQPIPKDPSMFPTFPSKSSLEKVNRSPTAPRGPSNQD